MTDQDEWAGIEVAVARNLTVVPERIVQLLTEAVKRHGTAEEKLQVTCRDEGQADQLVALLKTAAVQSDPRVSVRVVRDEERPWVVVFSAKPFVARPRRK
jgi:hypothetical protein